MYIYICISFLLTLLLTSANSLAEFAAIILISGNAHVEKGHVSNRLSRQANEVLNCATPPVY